LVFLLSILFHGQGIVMKKIVASFALLALLAACGAQQKAAEAPKAAAPAPKAAAPAPAPAAAKSNLVINAPGNYQPQVGCSKEWDPACPATLLADRGDGIYSYSTDKLKAGAYEVKIAYDGSWKRNFGKGGNPDGQNIGFKIAQGQVFTINFDPKSKQIEVVTK
jgi:hypothetical protein